MVSVRWARAYDAGWWDRRGCDGAWRAKARRRRDCEAGALLGSSVRRSLRRGGGGPLSLSRADSALWPRKGDCTLDASKNLDEVWIVLARGFLTVISRSGN